MANFEFNPFADAVKLHVRCPECGTDQDLYVCPPSADFSAETHRESANSDISDFECSNCGFTFEVAVTNGIGGGDGDILNIPDENLMGYEEIFPEDDEDDWEDIPDDFYIGYVNPHVKEIRVAVDKLDCLDEDTRALLYRDLYANVISCMEAYLSDTAIQRIMNSSDFKRKFVESSIKYQDTQFKLSDIYRVNEKLNDLIEERLREIIYHKLETVKPLYKCTFGIDLGDISDLKRAIVVRHDIVHRNGHDKNGKMNVITKEKLIELISKVSDFIENIESQFYRIDNPGITITDKEFKAIFGD